MFRLKKIFFIICLILLAAPCLPARAAKILPPESFLIKSKNPISTETDLKSLGISEFKKIDSLGFYEIETTPENVNLLAEKDSTEFIEKNGKVKISQVPNDPLFQTQTYLTNSDIVKAWDTNPGSPNITVAVIDTGIDYNHEDLKNKMWTDKSGFFGYDFVNSDTDPMDDNGHGTEIAGIIAAQSNNGIGIAGIANVKIMAVKAVPDTGEGDVADLARGIIYAADNGARVANVSLGLAEDSQTLDDAITYARNKNCLIVAATGNLYRSFIDNPARNPDAVGVGAVDEYDNKASYSNYGEGISLVALGNQIYSTSWDQTNSLNSYKYGSGTSFATPQVTGTAALIVSQDPSLTTDQVKKRLISSAKKISSMGGLNYSTLVGYGKLDAYSALNYDKYPPEINASLNKNLNGSYTITGTVEDDKKSSDIYTDVPDSNIGLVRYEVDGKQLWTNLNETPIQTLDLNANTLVLASGDHDILVEATDTAGNKISVNLNTKTAVSAAPPATPQASNPITSLNPADYRDFLVSQSPYPTSFTNGKADLSISFKNTGKATWYKNSVKLGTSNPNDRTSIFADSSWAFPNRVLMKQDSVTPGETADFIFTITLPQDASGDYKEYFNLVAEGISWFPDEGIYWEFSAGKTSPSYSAQFIDQSPYVTMNRGTSSTLWVEYKNVGSATWNSDVVKLGTSNPLDRASIFYDSTIGSGWKSINRIGMDKQTVMPGETARFDFIAKAPDTPGTYYEGFRPVADGVKWLEDIGLFWKITVQ